MCEKTTYEQQLETQGILYDTTRGFSMRPFLRSGEDMMVITRKGPERCRKYDAILYRRSTGKYVLHRIVAVRPDSYVLRGDNCLRREYGITDDQVLGVLTAVIRKGQKMDVNRWSYRMSVKLWCWSHFLRMPWFFLREQLWQRKQRKNTP